MTAAFKVVRKYFSITLGCFNKDPVNSGANMGEAFAAKREMAKSGIWTVSWVITLPLS